MTNPGWYDCDGMDLALRLKLQPRAGSDGFAGLQQDRLRIRFTAPPVGSRANAHLCRRLARVSGVAKTAVTIEQDIAGTHEGVRNHDPSRLPEAIADDRTA